MTRRAWLSAGGTAAFANGPGLLVAAASDLSALEAPLRSLAGGNLRFTFGSSGMLARQITHGAPFDVFLSADSARAEELTRAGKLLAPTPYALGRVALWSKSGKWRSLADLPTYPFRHLALANPAHAPYGRAARQALERAQLWRAVEPRIVLAENVRQAWQFAESGNAELCLTAWSLVHARGGALVPAALHDPVLQVGGIVQASRQKVQARAFLTALAGPAGQRLLTANGFETP